MIGLCGSVLKGGGAAGRRTSQRFYCNRCLGKKLGVSRQSGPMRVVRRRELSGNSPGNLFFVGRVKLNNFLGSVVGLGRAPVVIICSYRNINLLLVAQNRPMDRRNRPIMIPPWKDQHIEHDLSADFLHKTVHFVRITQRIGRKIRLHESFRTKGGENF